VATGSAVMALGLAAAAVPGAAAQRAMVKK